MSPWLSYASASLSTKPEEAGDKVMIIIILIITALIIIITIITITKPEEAGDNVMILQLLSKDQPLHAVIVGQEGHLR